MRKQCSGYIVDRGDYKHAVKNPYTASQLTQYTSIKIERWVYAVITNFSWISIVLTNSRLQHTRKTSTIPDRSSAGFLKRISLLLLMACLYPFSASAQTCPAFPISVASETDLNTAIGCYNSAAAADYQINLTQDITLTAATTAINNTQGASLQINGNTHFIDGASAYRVFNVSASTVTIDNITLQNGSANIGGALFIASGAEVTLSNSSVMNSSSKSGGGIRNDGTITISNSLFTGNSTTRSGEGGGLSNYGTAHVLNSTFVGNTAAFGAALYSRGVMTVSNSTVSGNSASGLAGGIYVFWTGNVTVYNSTLYGSSANTGGGILNNGGTFNFHNSIVAFTTKGSNCYGSIGGSNSLSDDSSCGGNVTQSSSISLGDLADNGCAIQHATPTGLACLQTHALNVGSAAIDTGDNAVCAAAPVNNLDQRGIIRPQNSTCDIGAFEICTAVPDSVATEQELNRAITCYNSAAAADYQINLTQDITLTTTTRAINNTQGASLQINGNAHFIDGANAYRVFTVSTGTVAIDGITLQNGAATSGGALFIASSADMTLTNSSIISSTSSSGGGIRNDGTFNVSNSLFTGNSAISPGGEGGGLSNYGTAHVANSTFVGNTANIGAAIYTSGVLNVSNSTLSGNTASNFGGAIYVFRIGNATVTNTTLSNNSASTGGGILNNGGTINMFNSIVANSTSGSNCFGTIGGNNSLSDDDSCGGNVTQSSNINLGALADNGCVVQHATSTGLACLQTHALNVGSDAITAGDSTVCTTMLINNLDQRGIIRPTSSSCDIGAVQVCPSFPVSVATEVQLNSALACYHSVAAGSYEINLTQGITLTASTAVISNTQGALLKLNGNTYFIDGASNYRVFNVSAGNVTFDMSVLQNGSSDLGGALFIASGAEVTLTNSSIMNSNANSGGGIHNDGTLTVSNSLFTGNSTTESGEGGGLSNYGTATISSSTLLGNSASIGAALSTRGILTVSNSTLSGNAASTHAGGLYVYLTGNTTVYNTTLSNNSADVGAAIQNNAGILNLYNTLIANSPAGSHCDGIIGGNNNLSDDNSCGGNVTESSGIDLAALTDNDCLIQHAASTGLACLQTHDLNEGSTAIDAGDTSICAADPITYQDQRGFDRSSDCEIGALEFIPEEMCFPIKAGTGVGMICF